MSTEQNLPPDCTHQPGAINPKARVIASLSPASPEAPKGVPEGGDDPELPEDFHELFKAFVARGQEIEQLKADLAKANAAVAEGNRERDEVRVKLTQVEADRDREAKKVDKLDYELAAAKREISARAMAEANGFQYDQSALRLPPPRHTIGKGG